jgi:hypothetical protein
VPKLPTPHKRLSRSALNSAAQQHQLTTIFTTMPIYSLAGESLVNEVTGYVLRQRVVSTSFIFAADPPNLIFQEYQHFFTML